MSRRRSAPRRPPGREEPLTSGPWLPSCLRPILTGVVIVTTWLTTSFSSCGHKTVSLAYFLALRAGLGRREDRRHAECVDADRPFGKRARMAHARWLTRVRAEQRGTATVQSR